MEQNPWHEFAAAQIGADMRIRSIRDSSDVPISSLSRQDPLRRQFGMLHGVSSLLLLAQVVCAGVALAMDKEAYGSSRIPHAERGGESGSGSNPERSEGSSDSTSEG